MNSHAIADIRTLYEASLATGFTPNVVATALRECTNLLSKYGVQDDELETAEFAEAIYKRTTRNISAHLKILVSAVGQLHDCVAVNGDKGVEFRGYDLDARVAPITLEYLTDAMERCLSENKRTGAVRGGCVASLDFRMGFAVTLFQKTMSIVECRHNTAKFGPRGITLIERKMQFVNLHCRWGCRAEDVASECESKQSIQCGLERSS